jgi:tetratricopeptide (TPR) repeat protein
VLLAFIGMGVFLALAQCVLMLRYARSRKHFSSPDFVGIPLIFYFLPLLIVNIIADHQISVFTSMPWVDFFILLAFHIVVEYIIPTIYSSNEKVISNRKKYQDIELAKFDETIKNLENNNDVNSRIAVAKNLNNKAELLSRFLNRDDRFDLAIEICDQIIAKFKQDNDQIVRKEVIRALWNKASYLCKTVKEAGAYDDIVNYCNGDNGSDELENIAFALYEKARTSYSAFIGYKNILVQKGDPKVATATYDEVIKRFKNSENEKIVEILAKSSYMKAEVLLQSGYCEAINIYKGISQKFGGCRIHIIKTIVNLSNAKIRNILKIFPRVRL